MRRVWGWTPARSAATEMTKTALVGSGPLPPADRLAGSVLAMDPLLQIRARRLGGRRRQFLDRLTLGVAQRMGDADLDGDQQVSGREPAAGGHPLAPHPEGAA